MIIEYELALAMRDLCAKLKLSESEYALVNDMPVAYQYRLLELSCKATPAVMGISTVSE